MTRLVVVDIEGNGQVGPDLVELGMVSIVDDAVIGTVRTWLVKPPRPVTAMARAIHGIRNADLTDAPTAADIRTEVLAVTRGAVLVGHNPSVDLAVMTRAFGELGHLGVIDTLTLARRRHPGLGSYRLAALAESLGLAEGLGHLTPHRTEYDATVCARLFVRLGAAALLSELDQPALDLS